MECGRPRGSDFSIARILADEPRGECAPGGESWLRCTRYRPPKVPRSSNGGARARRSGRHARVPFTAAQAAALEAAYRRAPYLAPPALRALAAALALRDDRIKIWFQNRRARERREKSATIAPPTGVALPANVRQAGEHWPSDVTPHTTTTLEGRREVYRNVELAYIGVSFGQCGNTPGIDPEDFSHTKGTERAESPLDVESIDD